MTATIVPEWTLGDRLRKARESAGYATPAALAEHLSVTAKTVIRYERGTVAPRIDVLNEWAQATAVSSSWLLSGDPVTATHRSAKRTRSVVDERVLVGAAA